jgi:hypothetical protein
MFPVVEIEDLDMNNRDIVSNLYDRLISDAPLFLFNFSKSFIFKALPAYFANQYLCVDEPVSPLNTDLFETYRQSRKFWRRKHKGCKRCKLLKNCNVFQIVDNVTLEMETSVQILPNFIYQQFLFENEPCNVSTDVKEFYEFYVSCGKEKFEDCCDKQTVVDYHQDLLNLHYPKALDEWKLELSSEKLRRYMDYCSLRSIQTTPSTDTSATIVKPISI